VLNTSKHAYISHSAWHSEVQSHLFCSLYFTLWNDVSPTELINMCIKKYLAFSRYLCCPNLIICSPAVTLHWPWRLLADLCGKDHCPTFFLAGGHTTGNLYPKWVVK